MQTLVVHLAEKTILTDANLRRMKHYIAQKFPSYSSARRADILANSVHRHLNESIPHMDPLTQKQLCIQLLHSAYDQSVFRIAALDIFKACLKLSFEKQDILAILEDWLHNQTGHTDAGQIKEFIEQMYQELAPEGQSSGLSCNSSIHNEDIQFNSLSPFHSIGAFKLKIIGVMLAVFVGAFAMPTPLHHSLMVQQNISDSLNSDTVMTPATIKRLHPNLITSELTLRFSYTPVDKDRIRQWLTDQNSKLAEEPYFSAITSAAEKYNIHPLLLFAIAGQEQGLVPKANVNAMQIANNPFNVHHSWREYNTTIADSSRIAAETILSLVKGRPEGMNPIEWINRKYAEDKQWHIGVEQYFELMLSTLS